MVLNNVITGTEEDDVLVTTGATRIDVSQGGNDRVIAHEFAGNPAASQFFGIFFGPGQKHVTLTSLHPSFIQVGTFGLSDLALGGDSDEDIIEFAQTFFVADVDGTIEIDGIAENDRVIVNLPAGANYSLLDRGNFLDLSVGYEDSSYFFGLHRAYPDTIITDKLIINQNPSNVNDTVSITGLSSPKEEGDQGSRSYTFNVVREGDLTNPAHVEWAVEGSGQFPASKTDFIDNMLPSGTLFFEPGQSDKSFFVEVQGDTDIESNEEFTVRLRNASETITIANGSAKADILNDDHENDTGTVNVYRFFNTKAGGHFFTASAEERDFAANIDSFDFEGTGFRAFKSSSNLEGVVPVYRFFNANAEGHFFTTNEAERTVVEKLDGFKFEGVGFYAHNTEIDGSVPVYRFFNTNAGGHFFTISMSEAESAAQVDGFNVEGIGFYAFPDSISDII